MPLIKRSSKAARATNIRRLIDEGYPPRQAVAIAYSTQRAARARNRAGAPEVTFVHLNMSPNDEPRELELAREAFGLARRQGNPFSAGHYDEGAALVIAKGDQVVAAAPLHIGFNEAGFGLAIEPGYESLLPHFLKEIFRWVKWEIKSGEIVAEQPAPQTIPALVEAGYTQRGPDWYRLVSANANAAGGRRRNRAGKAPKAPRPPAGTPTSGNLYVLHTELEDHEKRNGQPQPLNAFSATSMGAIRRLLKAGYLAPAAGYPRGYWVTTGQGDSALHEWRIRHAGAYGIPANYGQNAAGGRRRNRAGFSGEPYTVRNVTGEKGGPLLYVSRIGNRAAAYSPHDGFTVFGAMDGGELRVSYGKKGKHYSTPKTAEAAIRRWILEERREGANRAGARSTARKPSARSYAERLRSNADDFHSYRIDYETFSDRNKRIWSEVNAAGKKTHEGVLKLLREEAGKGPARR